MAEFRLSAIIDGVEYVKEVEISDHELLGEPYLTVYQKQYRKNVIEKYMNKWALSLFKLSWEEVKEDEDHAYRTHPSITEP